MEVENYPKWKETTIGGKHFSLPWLWEEGLRVLTICKAIMPWFYPVGSPLARRISNGNGTKGDFRRGAEWWTVWIQFVWSNYREVTRTSPQKVAFWKGNGTPYFRGNPGWWNIMHYHGRPSLKTGRFKFEAKIITLQVLNTRNIPGGFNLSEKCSMSQRIISLGRDENKDQPGKVFEHLFELVTFWGSWSHL